MFRRDGKSSGGQEMDTAARVLSLAQQTADQAIADAKKEARLIIDAANEEAARIIADARNRAQEI
jgi:vacuolar-type H+-ATPase subunit H